MLKHRSARSGSARLWGRDHTWGASRSIRAPRSGAVNWRISPPSAIAKEQGMKSSSPIDPLTRLEWQIDVLFGMQAANEATLIALARTHPDPDQFWAE